MKKSVLSLIMIVPIAGWAQNPSGQSYTLQAKYKVGEVNRYQTSMLTQTALPSMGTTNMSIHMTQEQKTEKVLPDGSAEITVTTLNSRGTMNDKPITMETDTKPIKMVMDKRGNVKSYSNLPKTVQSLSGMFGGNSQLSGAYLPTKPVKVGESWTATVAVPSGVGARTLTTFKSTLLRVEQVGRFHTARIRTQMTAPMGIMTDGQGQITQDAAKAFLKMAGKISMTYDTNFAIDEGKLIRSAIKGTVNMTGKVLSPSKPASKTAKSSAKAKPDPAQTVAIQVQMQMGNSLIE